MSAAWVIAPPPDFPASVIFGILDDLWPWRHGIPPLERAMQIRQATQAITDAVERIVTCSDCGEPLNGRCVDCEASFKREWEAVRQAREAAS